MAASKVEAEGMGGREVGKTSRASKKGSEMGKGGRVLNMTELMPMEANSGSCWERRWMEEAPVVLAVTKVSTEESSEREGEGGHNNLIYYTIITSE